MKHIERYFKRRGIAADHILYAYRNERNLYENSDNRTIVKAKRKRIPRDRLIR